MPTIKKKLVHERQKKTGESYQQALRHVRQAVIPPGVHQRMAGVFSRSQQGVDKIEEYLKARYAKAVDEAAALPDVDLGGGYALGLRFGRLMMRVPAEQAHRFAGCSVNTADWKWLSRMRSDVPWDADIISAFERGLPLLMAGLESLSGDIETRIRVEKDRQDQRLRHTLERLIVVGGKLDLTTLVENAAQAALSGERQGLVSASKKIVRAIHALFESNYPSTLLGVLPFGGVLDPKGNTLEWTGYVLCVRLASDAPKDAHYFSQSYESWKYEAFDVLVELIEPLRHRLDKIAQERTAIYLENVPHFERMATTIETVAASVGIDLALMSRMGQEDPEEDLD